MNLLAKNDLETFLRAHLERGGRVASARALLLGAELVHHAALDLEAADPSTWWVDEEKSFTGTVRRTTKDTETGGGVSREEIDYVEGVEVGRRRVG